MILATSDGGRKWRRQLSGGERVAVLGVYGRAATIPWELWAQLSASQDYRTHVAMIATENLGSAARFHSAERFQEAFSGLGASGAVLSRLPTPEPSLRLAAGQIVGLWDQSLGSSSLTQLTEQLVRVIRLWRPDVIVTRAALDSDDGMDHLLEHLVRDAVELSGEEQAYRGQLDIAGLNPWKVKLMVVETATRSGHERVVSPHQMALSRGETVAQLACGAKHVLGIDHATASQARFFRPLDAEAASDSSAGAGDDLLHGISIPYGTSARRQRSSLANLGLWKRTAQQRRHIEGLMKHGGQLTGEGAQLLEHVDRLARELEPRGAGDVLVQLAQRFRSGAGGQFDLAAETYGRLVERNPDHPLSDAAMLWLLAYESSAEIAWHAERQNPRHVRLAAATVDVAEQAADPLRAGRLAARAAPDPSYDSSRWQRAMALSERLRSSRPDLFAEPVVRFPLAAVYREMGRQQDATNTYRALLTQHAEAAWRERAAAELALSDAKANPPPPLCRCRETDKPPHLDGQLVEELWQAAEPIALTGAQGKPGGEARVAYDRDHLYYALHCSKRKELEYLPGPTPRSRDSDLSEHDRVDLLVDINRDYTTCWQLTVDYRGWTGESVWGDVSWNPRWYVAEGAENDTWTAEVAIPFAELGSTPRPGEVWALGVQRIIPGVGFQAWSQSAKVSPGGEGWGLLVFE
jgi:LmbE family N-acetylglucosaminyl deacetylase